jgi:group I intron endonuclease
LQFSILLGCDKDDLLKIEQYFLDSYNPYFNCLKIAGRPLGFKHSEETKKRLSKLMKGNNHGIGNKSSLGKKQSPETILKRVSKTKGMKRTDEFRKKTSERQKGQKSINHFPKGYKTGKLAWNKGKPPSEEQKRKRRETMLKKKLNLTNNFFN